MTIDNGPVICNPAPGNSSPPQPTRTDDLPSLLTSYGISGAAACGTPPAKAAARTVRRTARRIGSLQNHWSALSAPSIPAIVPCACFGLPPRCDGSLGRHRRRGHGFVVIASRLGTQQREPDALQCGQRGPIQRHQPCLRPIRALRPSICRAAFFGWKAKHEKIWKSTRSVSGCFVVVIRLFRYPTAAC